MPKRISREDFHLYLRTDKKRKNGKMPLYIRFKRIDGEEPKYPLKGYLGSFEEWDRDNQSPIPPSKELDEEIDRIIRTINFRTIDEGFEMSKSLLKNIVVGELVQRPENESFYEHFNNFLSIRKENRLITESTYKAYITTLNALKEFRKTIRIRDINAKLLNNFNAFLTERGKKKGKENVDGSITNRCNNIKAVIKYIEAKKIPIENPYSTGEVSKPRRISNDVFLDFKEFTRMHKLMYKLKETTVEYRVLLMYLFSCIEGLRISDVLVVKWGDLCFVRKSIILKLQLQKNRNKKITRIAVPIFPMAEEILERAPEGNMNKVEHEKNIFDYGYNNKKINETLKKLANMAKIDKNVTFHSSRRTFATLANAQGTQPVQIQSYMGHNNIRTTMLYIKDYENETDYPSEGHHLFSLRLLFKRKL